MEKLYSTKEAAKFLGVSVRTLKYWRKSGKLVPEIKGANGLRGGREKGAKYTEEQLKRVQTSAKRVTLARNMSPLNPQRVTSRVQLGKTEQRTLSQKKMPLGKLCLNLLSTDF